MNSSPEPSLFLSPTSSSDYAASDAISESQTFLNQPPAPPPQLHGNTLPSEVVLQSIEIAAQSHDLEQAVPTQPLINTCDKSSLQDISERLQSLNSSISDAVDALMDKKLKNLRMGLRSPRSARYLPPLMRIAAEECGRMKNGNMEVRNKFQRAILHDFIIKFIYDCIEGMQKKKISSDYKKFRMNIDKVRNTGMIVFLSLGCSLTLAISEAFAEAQNWARITAKLFRAPPDQTWKKLALALKREIDKQFWRITEGKQETQRRYTIDHKTAQQHFPAIIKTAFELSMEIHSGILSQRLVLTVGMKGSRADPAEVEMGEDLALVTSVQLESRRGKRLIMGNRGFGLTAEFNDGTKKVYLKPMVDYR
jgi:hypothetical protein